jgi:hypothetical protein
MIYFYKPLLNYSYNKSVLISLMFLHNLVRNMERKKTIVRDEGTSGEKKVKHLISCEDSVLVRCQDVSELVKSYGDPKCTTTLLKSRNYLRVERAERTRRT